MKRTGSMASRVPPAVTSTRHAREVVRPAGGQHPLDRGDDVGGLGQAAGADVAAGEAALGGRHDVHAPRGAGRRGCPAPPGAPTSRCASPGRPHRGPGGEQGGGQQVVGVPAA